MTTIALPDRWLFGGVDLSTFAQVAQVSAGEGLPAPRGENYLTPSLPGRRHVPKADDQARVALALTIFGANAAGGLDIGIADELGQAQANLDALRTLFGRRHLTQPLVHVLPGGTQRTGQAAVADFSSVEVQAGRALFGAIVDFELPDPYLYGVDVVDGPRAIAVSPTDFVLTHPGSARGHRFTLDFLGPISNPRVTNLLTGVYVECFVTVAPTKHLVIDVSGFTAANDGVFAGGSIGHSGDFRWLLAEPGAQTLRVTGTGLTGATRLTTTFNPPFHL
jgi:hypothetical protein